MNSINIRLTGVLLKGDKILLLEQETDTERSWSLPGGKLEFGESIEDGLRREIKEETGLEVSVGKLLYITDYFPSKNKQIIHMTFLINETGGILGDIKLGADTREIKSVKFIPVKELVNHGFSEKFMNLVLSNFPGAGSYAGPKPNIGL